MAEFVPFEPHHFQLMRVHPEFAEQAAREDPEALARSKEAWSLIDLESGEVLAIMGAIETYAGVFYVWGYLSDSGGRYLIRLTRFVAGWVRMLGAVRIECTIRKNFKCGHRWMRMLNFKRETARPMKLWDGFADFHLYSRVRP